MIGWHKLRVSTFFVINMSNNQLYCSFSLVSFQIKLSHAGSQSTGEIGRSRQTEVRGWSRKYISTSFSE
jgi:hypothetical protein